MDSWTIIEVDMVIPDKHKVVLVGFIFAHLVLSPNHDIKKLFVGVCGHTCISSLLH